MRIAFVHNQCMPYRHFLFSRLADRFDIDFIFFNQDKDLIPSNCKAAVLKGIKVPEFSDFWIVPKLQDAISSRNYNLFIGSDLGAYITAVTYKVAKRENAPFIPWIEEWDYILHPRRQLRRRFEDRLLSYASTVVVPGINHQNYLQSRSVPSEKLEIVPNALEGKNIDLDLNHPLASRLKQISQRHRIICAIGRHVDFKGHHQLIKAQAELEKKQYEISPFLIIAGDGPLLSQNRSLAHSLSVNNILFVDHFVDSMEKSLLFHFADLFALASTRKRAFEAWGFVCNEAAAAGLPVIASSAVGCAEEVVRHGLNGFIFQDGCTEQLVEYLDLLVRDRTINKRFGLASKEIVKNYHPDIMVDRFSKVIQKYIH